MSAPLEYTNAIRRHPEVHAEFRSAMLAAARLGVTGVQRTKSGGWRPAGPWQGSIEATARADRALRLRHAERSLRASGPDADRRRRLRLALAEVGR